MTTSLNNFLEKDVKNAIDNALEKASDGNELDFFGWRLDLSGDHLFVGAYETDIDGEFGQGAAYLYGLRPAVPIPTLSQWALIILGITMLIIGWVAVKENFTVIET